MTLYIHCIPTSTLVAKTREVNRLNIYSNIYSNIVKITFKTGIYVRIHVTIFRSLLLNIIQTKRGQLKWAEIKFFNFLSKQAVEFRAKFPKLL